MPIVLGELDVQAGNKREMFSLPFQMTARYVKEHPDDVADDERYIIDKTLEYDTLAERYNPYCADPVKSDGNLTGAREYVDYFKVWLMQGLRHPDAYFKAANCMIAGWFSWDEWAPLMNNNWRNQFAADEIPEDVPERGVTQGTADAYQELVHGLYDIPFLKLFHTFAFWASLTVAFALCTAVRSRKVHKNCWLALTPVLFALFFGCWLAPLSNFGSEGIRYLLPVVYATPLMFAWCFYLSKSYRNKLSG